MPIKTLLLSFAFSTCFFSATPPSGEAIFRKMYDRYAGKWYPSFTFNQTTEVYRNDTLRRKETWYEAMQFPGHFRIDFGDRDSGNAVIYTRDSAFTFRKGQLRGVRKDANDLVFLLGGVYSFPYEESLAKLKALKYDMSLAHEDNWKGKPVYVIGAGKDNLSVNQLWIDKEKLFIVRMITFDNNRKEEALFEDHIPLGGGYTETKTIFYINDKLVQVETYHDCKIPASLDPRVFDPASFGLVYYYDKK